jgi:peptidoglycan/LPS O-acetylase OafA/YrhL
LTQAWVPPFWSAVNVPGWSLSVEAFFYALFPRLLAPVAWLTATPRRALAALVLLQGCALLAPALGTWRFGITHTDTSWLANFFRYLPPFALPEFAFGVVLGQLRVQGTLRAKPIARLYRPALLLLAFVLCSERVPYLFLHNGALLPLFAAVIVHNSFGADGAGWLARPWAIVLGNASYALYILHLPAWIYLKIAIERTGYDPLASWVFPVYSLLAIAISLAASAWIERRGRSWKTRSTSERVREEA